MKNFKLKRTTYNIFLIRSTWLQTLRKIIVFLTRNSQLATHNTINANPKSQYRNSKQIPNSKLQISNNIEPVNLKYLQKKEHLLGKFKNQTLFRISICNYCNSSNPNNSSNPKNLQHATRNTQPATRNSEVCHV
jgi:hypothetical protein